MNYQVFSYMPTGVASTGNPPPRPIRVTPSALSPLLYAILYSIEFQSPVGPRPPTLREHSAGRTSGGGGASGSSGGSAAAAAAPSAAALLTSAVFAVSSFWGRSSTTTAAPAAATTAPPQRQQQAKTSSSAFGGVGGPGIDGTAAIGASSSVSPPRAMTLAEEAELAALQRQHEQPFVVPVTQVLHKLGGVHITVRETHNATITTAYARAMEEVENIVSEHEQRLTRQSLRSTGFPSQSSGLVPNGSPSASALSHSGGTTATDSAAAKEDSTVNRYAPTQSTAASADARHLVGLPASPASPSRSELRMGSPVSGVSAAAWAVGGARGSDTTVNSSSANHNAIANPSMHFLSRTDDFTPGPDEVGLVLSVRLLSKEVTRWRIAHERPLAEWRFPIIRTSSERMMVRSRTQSPAYSSPSEALGSGGGGLGTPEAREMGGDDTNAARDFMLVNDAAQMHQVLEFILKSSYQTTSMETFTDFTSGELVFDAHVQERRRFS